MNKYQNITSFTENIEGEDVTFVKLCEYFGYFFDIAEKRYAIYTDVGGDGALEEDEVKDHFDVLRTNAKESIKAIHEKTK